jgi:hypothetical protein
LQELKVAGHRLRYLARQPRQDVPVSALKYLLLGARLAGRVLLGFVALFGRQLPLRKIVRAIILILLAAAVGLGVLATQQAATIKDQQSRLSAAEERVKVTSLAQQTRCADEARKWFVQQQIGVNDLASYENHYNVKLNMCMIAVESKFIASKVVIEFISVVNVLENKQLGNYVRQVAMGRTEDARLTHCTVTNSSGEVRQCQSLDEFKKLGSLYMEG